MLKKTDGKWGQFGLYMLMLFFFDKHDVVLIKVWFGMSIL